MTNVANIQAGGRTLAAMLRAVAPLAALKSDSQSVSGETLVADNSLALQLSANAVYMFICNLVYVGGAQGSSDLHWGWSLPSGGVASYQAIGYGTNGGQMAGSSLTQAAGGTAGTTTTDRCLLMIGTVGTGSEAGTMQLEWAQNTTNATPTTVGAGSILAAWQVV